MLLHVKNLKKNIANIIPQTRVKLHELKENKYCIGIVEAKVGMRNKNWIQGFFRKKWFQHVVFLLTNANFNFNEIFKLWKLR